MRKPINWFADEFYSQYITSYFTKSDWFVRSIKVYTNDFQVLHLPEPLDFPRLSCSSNFVF